MCYMTHVCDTHVEYKAETLKGYPAVVSEDVGVGSADATLGMRSTRTCSTRGLDVGRDSFICVT